SNIHTPGSKKEMAGYNTAAAAISFDFTMGGSSSSGMITSPGSVRQNNNTAWRSLTPQRSATRQGTMPISRQESGCLIGHARIDEVHCGSAEYPVIIAAAPAKAVAPPTTERRRKTRALRSGHHLSSAAANTGVRVASR